MTEQFELFTGTGPTTSQEAFDSIDPSMLEARVLEVIASFGESGCISDEVRGDRRLQGLSYSSVTARYASLIRRGKVERTDDRRPGNSGRNQSVMRAL